MRAAAALAEAARSRRRAPRSRSTRSLPVASGIGGGSADAAAALRLLTSIVGHRSGPCGRGRAAARQRRSGLPAQPAGAGRGGRGRADADRAAGLVRTRRCCWSTRACRCRPPRCSRAGTAIDRGPARRLARGLQRPRSRRDRAGARRSRPCSRGCGTQPGAEFVRMSGSRRDLLRLVRQRGGARRRRPRRSRANGGIWRRACARGRDDAPDPDRRRDARRRASGDRRRTPASSN